ncbi:MAG: L-threonylcarbamoyladenylate synthase [Nitrososphaerales archaeon]
MLSLNCDIDDLTDVTNIVKKGGIIIYPTDTLYGIGCNPYDEEAVNRIFRLKKRSNRPLPVLCSDIMRAEELVHLGDTGRRLASRFWPGGLTIVAKIAANNLPKELTGGSEGLGVRVPDHRGALKIISLCEGCLVGTSANVSGSKTPDTPEGIRSMFDEEVDVLIYGGGRPSGVQSTVVDLVSGAARIIREGAVPSEELLQIL